MKLKDFFRRRPRTARPTPSPSDGPARESLQKMIEMVARTQEVEYDCDQTKRLLDQFTEMVAQGEAAATLMPLVQQHLEMCPDCRGEFEALLRILRALPQT